MQFNSYLTFNGNCREAVGFYREVFNITDADIMSYGDTPPDPSFLIPDDAKNLVMHAELKIGEAVLFLADSFPGMPYDASCGDLLTIAVGKLGIAEATEIFNSLLVGGIENMPIQATFWSPAYGSVTDKFGVTWQISAQE